MCCICYSLFQGFYKVYGAVFCRIADEEEEYVDEGSERLPSFGEGGGNFGDF